MRRVIASEWLSLDGVVQGPTSPDEDPSGGFTRGGWHPRYFDDRARQWVVENVAGASGYLLGRGTYEIFAAHWPKASAEEQVLAGPLNERPKYVASTTLVEPLAWRHASLLGTNVAESVAALKRGDGGDLLAIGSPVLVRTLLAHGLVDELRLMIDPIVVGSGKRLFDHDHMVRALRLVHSETTTSGALLVTYLTNAT